MAGETAAAEQSDDPDFAQQIVCIQTIEVVLMQLSDHFTEKTVRVR